MAATILGAMLSASAVSPSHDDEDLALPPLDGSLDDAPKPAAEHDDHDLQEAPELGDDDGSAFDLDPAAEIEDIAEREGSGAEAAVDAVDLASIADEIAIAEEDARASDERGLSREEEEASLFDGAWTGDDGSGTGEDLAGFVDESALPPLGEDDKTEDAPAAAAIPWRGRYHAVSGLGAEVPCELLAVSRTFVVAAGPTVLVVREGNRVSRGRGPDGDVVAIAATDDAILAASRRGVLFTRAGGDATWTPMWVLEPGLLDPAVLAIETAATPGRFWIRQGNGLWSLRFGGGTSEPLAIARENGVWAIAPSGSALLVVTQRDGALALERLRGDDEASEVGTLPVTLDSAGGPIGLAATSKGRGVALAAGGFVHVSRDGGRTWQKHEIAGARAVTFAGEDASAKVVVLAAEDRRDAQRARLFEIEEGGGAALAWDAAREVLWVACGAGLLAFERSSGH